jgi:hypothetical protein
MIVDFGERLKIFKTFEQQLEASKLLLMKVMCK